MRSSETVFQLPTLVDLLRWRAGNQPEQRGYTFLPDGEKEGACLTYAALDHQARAIAASLQDRHLTGERVLLLYPPGLEYVAALFSCFYAGAVAVPAYPPLNSHSLARIDAIASDARAAVALTTRKIQAEFEQRFAREQSSLELQWLATDMPDPKNHAADAWREPGVNDGTLALLQYTSGSTGRPKGVMVSHGNLMHNLRLIYDRFEHSPECRSVIWLPPYHDMGLVGGILEPLYGGFDDVLMPPMAFLQRPARWLQAVSRYQGTTSGGPNFAYELCVQKIGPEQKADLDLSSWEVAFTGAEPVRAETIEQFTAAFASCGFRQESFYPCYGMAEATLMISGGLKANPVVFREVDAAPLENNRAVTASDGRVSTRKFVGCGQVSHGQRIVIVDPESHVACGPGEIGEIWVSGPSVAQGYWNRPAETEQSFLAYLSNTGEGPFLRTGDLGFIDQELFITGRLKDVIIIRGRNHHPQDIEQTVERCNPALRPAYGAAFCILAQGEERLVIVQEVLRTHLQNLNSIEAVKDIRQAVAKHHQLQAWDVLLLRPGSILKTSSGKIRRQACRDAYLSGGLLWDTDLHGSSRKDKIRVNTDI